MNILSVAERARFELADHFHDQQFSRLSHSTTLPPLHLYLYYTINKIVLFKKAYSFKFSPVV